MPAGRHESRPNRAHDMSSQNDTRETRRDDPHNVNGRHASRGNRRNNASVSNQDAAIRTDDHGIRHESDSDVPDLDYSDEDEIALRDIFPDDPLFRRGVFPPVLTDAIQREAVLGMQESLSDI